MKIQTSQCGEWTDSAVCRIQISIRIPEAAAECTIFATTIINNF